MVKIGIVYEGTADSDVVERIVHKILAAYTEEYEIVKLVPANSGIIGFLRSYVVQLFDVCRADVAVYFTDQDVPEERDDRRRTIREEIERIRPGCGIFSAIGLSNPHIEQWLFADEDLLKRIFSCEGSSPLPFPEQQAKSRLKSLWNQMPSPKPSMRETALLIIDEIDLERLRRYPGFSSLADDLLDAFRQVRLLGAT